jgi:hypothetical protein
MRSVICRFRCSYVVTGLCLLGVVLVETGPTSGSKNDAPSDHQTERTSGDREIDDHVFHRATRTGKRDTVEVSAPAEAEEVTP